MGDIYQEIWDADQHQSGGVPALVRGQEKDPKRGYAVVDEQASAGTEHRLFSEVLIPEDKMATYRLCQALFNNYTLDQTKLEDDTPEEADEVHNLLEAVVDTAPMKVAREYVTRQSGTDYDVKRWYNLLHRIWFRQFDDGKNRNLSGFEHVYVGEQKQGKVQGYHFWYKYYLEDLAGTTDDAIDYLGLRYQGDLEDEILIPDSVTLSYRWRAYDYEAQKRRSLTKPIGGFMVGCSPEGLMALGTVRFLEEARAPKEGVINGGRYAWKMFRSPDGKSLRTVFPEFLGLAENARFPRVPQPAAAAQPTRGVRIIGALVVPAGGQMGNETVTLFNVSPAPISLQGWRIEDGDGRAERLSEQGIGAGQALTIPLSGRGARLGDRGGVLHLRNAENKTVHRVTYDASDVGDAGWTVLF